MLTIEADSIVQGVWKKENSPYLVKGQITIPYGEKLVIEPGVEVRIQSRPYKDKSSSPVDYDQIQGSILCQGELEAIGTPENEILFTRSGEEGYWGNIVIDGTNLFQNSKPHIGNFRFCRVQFGSQSGIEFNHKKYPCSGVITFVGKHAKGSISTSIIHKNKWQAILCINAYPEIKGNHILENEGGGIGCTNSITSVEKPLILERNIIVRNNGGIQNANANVSIINCTIVHNFSCGISLSQRGNIRLPSIKNSILWGNERLFMSNPAHLDRSVTYSFINPEELSLGTALNETNILGDNPGFVDSDNGNYNLKLDSICIGKGEHKENIGALDPGFGTHSSDAGTGILNSGPSASPPPTSVNSYTQPISSKDQCKYYLRTGNTQTAFGFLEAYFKQKSMTDEENEVILLRSRDSQIETLQQQGRISLQDYKLEYNNLIYAMLELCEKIED